MLPSRCSKRLYCKCSKTSQSSWCHSQAPVGLLWNVCTTQECCHISWVALTVQISGDVEMFSLFPPQAVSLFRRYTIKTLTWTLELIFLQWWLHVDNKCGFSLRSSLDFTFLSQKLCDYFFFNSTVHSNYLQIKLMVIFLPNSNVFFQYWYIFLFFFSRLYLQHTFILVGLYDMWTPIDICHVVWALPRRRHIIRAYSTWKQVCADCLMQLVNAVYLIPARHVTIFVVVWISWCFQHLTVNLWLRCTVDRVVIVFKGQVGYTECLDYVINSSV